jgi:hypothetical protein
MGANGTTIFSFNQLIVTNHSMVTSFNSPSWETKEIRTGTVQAVWIGGGSPVGLMQLSGSNDNINFTLIQGSILSTDGDNSGSNGWNIADLGYPYMQFNYIATSGSGTVSVMVSGKYI